LKYLRRGIWYIASRLLVICLILGIAVTIFYYAMNLSNLQIIMKDGMAMRAKVIMGIEDDASVLNRYFQPAALSSDELLNAALNNNTPYSDYNVRGIDHRLNMLFFWTWPWDTTVSVTLQESIPRIDGRVKGSRADEIIAQKGNRGLYPPDWPDTQYRVTLVKENGQWKIRSMTLYSGE